MTLAQKPRSELIKNDNTASEVIVTVVKDGDAIKERIGKHFFSEIKMGENSMP